MQQAKEKLGKKFGTLTVTALTKRRGGKGEIVLIVRCDCGHEKEITSSEVNRACYCSARCILRPVHKTHGLSFSPTYRSWECMIQRCRNPKSPDYYLYGQRGVSVDIKWLKFENFFSDMGLRPDGTTLDRIDPFGNYEVGNCRWATPQEQTSNRRNTKRFEFQGQFLTLTEWANRFSINPRTLYSRLFLYGYGIERALTAPIKDRSANIQEANV